MTKPRVQRSSAARQLADATERGDTEGAAYAIETGADPNTPPPDGDGLTPVVRAVLKGHVHIVKLLLKNGADVNSEVHPETGASALHTACETGQVAMGKLLLASGASVDRKDDRGLTPLQVAAGGQEAKSGEVVRELIASGASLDAVEERTCNTILHTAAFSGLPDIVKRLLRAGADLEANNQAGMTPLHLAASSNVEGRLPFVKSLINSGADIAATDRIGRTPLYLAAANGHSKIVAVLVAAGADASTQTLGGISALTAAAEESHVDVVRLLLKLGLSSLGGRRAWADALCSSARKGLVVALRQLIPAGGTAGLPAQKFLTRTGTSPLHCAAAGGHIRCVRVLLEAGADETALDRNECTPLEIVGNRRIVPKGGPEESRKQKDDKATMYQEQDGRIRRTLIKAFVYRSVAWSWPKHVGGSGCGGGDGTTTAGGLSKMKNELLRANLGVFRHQLEAGPPPPPAATFYKLLKYARSRT